MKIKNTIIAVGLLLGVALQTQAGLQTQIDGGTNNIAGNATNNYALPGDVSGSFTNGIVPGSCGPNQFYDVTKAQSLDVNFYGKFANTSATNVTVTVTYAASADQAFWTNNFTNITFTVTASTTNIYGGEIHIPGAPPIVAVRSVSVSPAFSSVTGTNLTGRGFTKNGI